MKINIGDFPKTTDRRRIDIHIEKFDTWNLDHTLALIILPALLQLKQEKHGVPGEFAEVGGEDYAAQSSFDFYSETHSEAFDAGIHRWDEILDKMIWSFQQIIDPDYRDKYTHGKHDFQFEKTGSQHTNPLTGTPEDTYTMVNKAGDDYWIDMNGLLEHEKRIQEGLELFGKYYLNLWD